MRWKIFLKKTFITLVILYPIVGVLLYFFQEKIIFHPQVMQQDAAYNFKIPYTELNINLAEHDYNIVQFHPKFSNDSTNKKLLLYFHGNMTNISHYADFAPYFTKHNYEVWMIDYPGYGKSRGRLTEKSIYRGALRLYDTALSKGYMPENIIIYGKSLGTGVASFLASQKYCRRLILETPYYSMPSLAKSYFPIYPSIIIKYKFPVCDYIQKVKSPVSILHGTYDGTIPYSNSSQLKSLLKPKDEFITIPGGDHNNLYNFGLMKNKIDSLLSL